MLKTKWMMSFLLLPAVCVGLLMPQPAVAAEPKELLKLVPQDAWGFIVLRSLETVDKKADELNKMLGLQLPPVSVLISGQFQLGDTLDTKSPFGLVVLDVSKHGGQTGMQAPPFVILVPAKDPKAMLAKLGAGEEKEGICACTIMQQPSFVAVKGKMLLLAQTEAVLKTVVQAEKNISEGVADARLAALEKSDLFISIAVNKAFAPYKDMFKMMLAPMLGVAGTNPADLDKAIKVFDEMDAIDIAATLDREGASLRMLFCPQKDSDLEKWMKDNKNSSESLLAVLPNEKYLLALGDTGGYSEHRSKFQQEQHVVPTLDMLKMFGLAFEYDKTAAETIDVELLKMTKAKGPSAVCISALPGGAEGMIGLAAVTECKDPKEYVESFRTIFTSVWKLCDDEDFQGCKEFVIHEKDSETLEGNKVDTIRFKMRDMAQQFEADEQDIKGAEGILGKDLVLRFGAVGGKHVVFTFGGGKQRYEALCKSVSAKSGKSLAEAEGIAALSKRLTSPRFAECYVAIDNIIHLFKEAAKLFEEEGEIPDVPPINAPVACGIAQIGSVMEFELVVPAKLITSIKKVFDDMMRAEERAFDEEDEEDAAEEETMDEEAEEDTEEKDTEEEGRR